MKYREKIRLRARFELATSGIFLFHSSEIGFGMFNISNLSNFKLAFERKTTKLILGVAK